MTKDRVILWSWIAFLALLIVGELVGNGMINHWRAGSDRFPKPDPAAMKLLAP